MASASYEARALGVKSAMSVATAKRLCPNAIFISGNFARYREASHNFMAILADFSPFIEPGGLDEAYLDATGFESLYGTARNMGVLIKKRVREELSLPVSLGIAGTKIVAKVASAASKPDGLLEIESGKEAAFLAPLAIGKMPGIGKKTEARLLRLGLKTLGEIATAKEELLVACLGSHGAHLRNFARGIDGRPVEARGEAKSMSRETTFAEDTLDRDFLLATLYHLTERVGADLRSHDRLARCVTLKLRYTDFTTVTRSQTFGQGIDADQAIFETGKKLLIQMITARKQPVRLIGIGLSEFVPVTRQLDMLDDKTTRLAELNRAVDRIRERYGFKAIQTGRTAGLE